MCVWCACVFHSYLLPSADCNTHLQSRFKSEMTDSRVSAATKKTCEDLKRLLTDLRTTIQCLWVFLRIYTVTNTLRKSLLSLWSWAERDSEAEVRTIINNRTECHKKKYIHFWLKNRDFSAMHLAQKAWEYFKRRLLKKKYRKRLNQNSYISIYTP